VLGERHHVLLLYMQYYNEVRTHLSLNKDAPAPRSIQRAGYILCRPILGGLQIAPPVCADLIYDRHTLRDVIEDTQKLTGCEIERSYVDKGYRGHDTQNPRRVFISGQKRGVFGVIKRELRRRSAIEPVISHMKAEGHLGRCYLKGTAGDAANAILTAVGHNLRLILAWLRILLRLILVALWRPLAIHSVLKLAC
jgi:hypothetical protein